MKFMALKAALEKVFPSAQDKVCPQPGQSVSPPVRPIPLYQPDGRKEIVAGGDILWRPVNRQSALIIAKAPWWAMPPDEPPPPPPAPVPEKRKRCRIHRAAKPVRCLPEPPPPPLLLPTPKRDVEVAEKKSEFMTPEELKQTLYATKS
jgi:hypothetical protein